MSVAHAPELDRGSPGALGARTLTDEQERAVARRRGSLLLAAGAGSGKTSVLVERFVRAVREDGVAPGRVLAITFTERAAGELRARVRARLLELDERDAAREAEAANVSTFHGFCARLLRAHPLQAEVEPGFEILEEGFAGRLRELAFGDALTGLLERDRAEAVDLVAAYGADPLRSMLLGTFAQLRSQGQREPRLPQPRLAAVDPGELGAAQEDTEAIGGEAAVRACALIGELLERFDAAYAQRKRERGALDFDDLELDARRLLVEHPAIRASWAERFELLMVDEFQDTNPRQLALLQALERDNLFTVGDHLQSIYGFRHADVGLFRERQALLAERDASLALTRNFRSHPQILMAVERVFTERMGARFTPLTAGAEMDEEASPLDERAHASASREPLVELLLTDKRGWDREADEQDPTGGLPPTTRWRQAEARLLARRIAELVAREQARAGEIVVLLRSLGDVPVYEAALRAHGLGTVAGVGGFWSHQQIGDLLAWLSALANPLDELALYSVLASPLVGVSSDGLALIAMAEREQRCGAWQTIERACGRDFERERSGGAGRVELGEALAASDAERLRRFHELFASERAGVALHPLPTLLRRVIAATGYEAHVRSLRWGQRRLANIHKLVRLARSFEAREGRDLRGLLEHVAHVGLAREADAPVTGELEAVRLMSIHAAKGLEFPVVCVADLGREPNLRVPDLLVDGAGGRVGLRLPALDGGEPHVALDYERIREQRRQAQEEEEDRILYVACTRAERRLLLSGAVAFERWPAAKPGVAPIAWLAPALVPDAPKLVQSEHASGGALTVQVGDGLQVRCALSAPGWIEAARLAHTGDRQSERLLDSTPEPRERPLAPAAPAPTSAVAPATAAPADADATMSYTSLSELERCGYRYYLEHVLGLPENRAARGVGRSEIDEGGLDARLRGSIVHELLESIDYARPCAPTPERVARVARRHGARLAPAARERIVALIAGALAAEPARRLSAAREAHAERPFAFSLERSPGGGSAEPLVTGIFDLMVELPDGSAVIVDYKSDRLAPEADLEEIVRRDYGFQRLLYALAAIESGRREVEVAHWFLERPEQWVSARFLVSDRDRLREQLLDRVARARARGFAVTDAPHRGTCLTCPGRGGLCSWGETRTMSERSTTLESQL